MNPERQAGQQLPDQWNQGMIGSGPPGADVLAVFEIDPELVIQQRLVAQGDLLLDGPLQGARVVLQPLHRRFRLRERYSRHGNSQ